MLQLQVVLSHTPFRELAKDLCQKPIVIAGRGAPEVATAYGFNKAVSTSQLSARFPTAVPFCHAPGDECFMVDALYLMCHACRPVAFGLYKQHLAR